MPGDRLSDAVGDQALDAGRPVVGADDHLVAAGAELVFPEHQAHVAEPEHADHEGAALLVGARLRIDRRHTEAAADADHLLRLPDVARDAHRPDHRVQPGADAAGLLHLARGLADRLDDQRDRPAVAVEVGDRQRNALAMLVFHDDHELTGLGRLGQQRMADLQQVGDVGEIRARDDFEVGHEYLSNCATSRSWPLDAARVATPRPKAARCLTPVRLAGRGGLPLRWINRRPMPCRGGAASRLPRRQRLAPLSTQRPSTSTSCGPKPAL